MSKSYSIAYEPLDILPKVTHGLKWFSKIRTQAKQQFAACGFPSLQDEEWRYTTLKVLEKTIFMPMGLKKATQINRGRLEEVRIAGSHAMVFINGYFSADLSDLDDLPVGVNIKSLADTLLNNPELIEPYLSKSTRGKEHGFIEFNSAWFTDGIFCHVASSTQLLKPLQLIHLVTEANCMANIRNIIVLEPSAEAQIIETFIGCDDAYASVSVSEIFLEKNTQLVAYKIQNEGQNAIHFGGIYVKQARDSCFSHHNIALGSALARTEVHTDLQQAAECDLNGLYLGERRQHLDNHTRINHLAPYTLSNELYKGVLSQRSSGVFQGRVLVDQLAQKTDSNMHNHTLLLSNDTEIDTKPQLEIYADDVKCAHGVTVGQLDETSIAYLQARCIDQVTAKNMLTFAFANEMVEKIKLKPLHDYVLTQVLARFPQVGIECSWLLNS